MRILRQGASLTVQTPAKLNLSLKILGRRADGFHDLQTCMVALRLCDILEFSPVQNADIRLSLFDKSPVISAAASIPTDERNLVIRAAELLRSVTGCQRGANIRLHKRIPSEAGLGGGSSDAAAALIGLNELWDLRLASKELHGLAAQLGSDVNFFLDSHAAAICTGRGEQIAGFPLLRQIPMVILKPLTGLSTAEVFRMWSQHPRTTGSGVESHEFVSVINSPNLNNISPLLVNDLQLPAEELNPQIQTALIELRRREVVAAAMTGSGSACFGICRTRRQALHVAGSLRQQRVGQVWATTTGV